MKILILGGTRFTGKALVHRFREKGEEVTVLSKSLNRSPGGVRRISDDKETGLKQIAGEKFDAVFDFICYDETGPYQVFKHINPGLYCLISSTWITRLSVSGQADEAIPGEQLHRPAGMPDITYNYLFGKAGAEASVQKLRSAGKTAVSLRLPIMWGKNDHTARLDFYRYRIWDSHPLILVNSGENYAQIAWNKDIAKVIHAGFLSCNLQDSPIWEALPDDGDKVKNYIKIISEADNISLNKTDISSEELSHGLPEYLKYEPLWRETPNKPSEHNIFLRTGITPTPFQEWIHEIVSLYPKETMNDLRIKEIKYIETRKPC